MSRIDPVVIVSFARTPMGGFLGDFKDVAAVQLGAATTRAVMECAGLRGDVVDERMA